MSLFIENGAKAKLSIYHHLLSDPEEFKRLTRPVKSTEYSYLRQSRFLGPSLKEEISLSQLCILGHGLNENIYLIGENSGIGILERKLYATFSYSAGNPAEFIIIPMHYYSDEIKNGIVAFFSDRIKKKAGNFRWRSLIENPYNKVYDELAGEFNGVSLLASEHFIEYCIPKREFNRAGQFAL